MARARRLGHRVVELRVQRVLETMPDQRRQLYNPSDAALFFENFGTTTAMINVASVTGPANPVEGAFIGPNLDFSPTHDGKVRCKVGSEAVNLVGVLVDLPITPPWKKKGSLAQAVSGVGQSRFESAGLPDNWDQEVTVWSHGLPSDGGFADLVEVHENHHVDDVFAIVDSLVRPWDTAITTFRQEDREVVGDDQEEAEARFYEHVGFTPAGINETFLNLCQMHGLAFHETVEGSNPDVGDAKFEKKLIGRNVLHLYWQHPLS